jgi:hypothetical protein
MRTKMCVMPVIRFISSLGVLARVGTSKNAPHKTPAAKVKMLTAKPILTRNSWTGSSFAFQKIRSGITITRIPPIRSP